MTDSNLPESQPTADLPSILSWAAIGLGQTSLDAVARQGFIEPTEVQFRSIPRIAAGVDLIVQAKTGSGKTLAFGLPLLERIDAEERIVQALVLTPTRELAHQVATELMRVSLVPNRIVPVFGGASMTAQIRQLREGAQVVVGTPGRILDHIGRGTLNLGNVRMVVLDEADEMLDRGFLPDVFRILEQTSGSKQTMLFSATVPMAIRDLADRALRSPESLIIGKEGLSVNLDIHHTIYKVPRLHKPAALVNVLHSLPRTKVLIFCNTKSDTETVAAFLHQERFAVGFLDGDLPQSVRTRTLTAFKDEVIDILVATDVAARGLDIFGVSHVINYDVPENKDLYIHRTGRTGRAGRTGEAITLVAPSDLLAIGIVQRTMDVAFEERDVPTRETVASRVKRTFIERLKRMEEEGYPDDLAMLADDLLESVDPYPAVAGLLTLLRRRGWELETGYDPENPTHKDRVLSQPSLEGLRSTQEKRDQRRGSRRPARGERDRGEQRDRGERERKPRRERRSEGAEHRETESDSGPAEPREEPRRRDDSERRASASEMVGLKLSAGREQGIEDEKALVGQICQIAGIRKTKIRRAELGETESRVFVDEETAQRIQEGFANRKRPPRIEVTPIEKDA